jgi:uncharacterized protein
MSDFSPWKWLSNPHAQTIWARVIRRAPLVTWHREIIDLPDGDELVLDHAGDSSSRFRAILLHGLEGSSDSTYIHGMASCLLKADGAVTAVNFRSCARPNRRPRLYHSGETTDFDFVARTLHARDPQLPLIAFGASLGGNVLLKWLGEHPGQRILAAGATISVPYDLGAGAKHLEFGARQVYVWRFLRTLKAKARRVKELFPEESKAMVLDDALRAKTFREFDDAATAPLHGFRDADDYYTRSSSIAYLSRIDTPVLCVSASDDPFLPPDVLERAKSVASPSVEFIVTRSGGHVGFVAGPPWRTTFWAEERIARWLTERAAAAAPSRSVA